MENETVQVTPTQPIQPPTFNIPTSLSVDATALVAALNQINASMIAMNDKLSSMVDIMREQPAPHKDPYPTQIMQKPTLPTGPTLDTLRDLFARASKAGHRESLAACLEGLGAKKLPDLKTSDYDAVAKYVKGLLNEA